MGLDISHNCWHGAYSAFSRWRQEIAKIAGYSVWNVEQKYCTMPTIMLDWGHVTGENLMGEWENTPTDPLIILFAHSDCEGKIDPKDAIPLANRLEELLPKLPREKDLGHIGDWGEKTKLFINGLRIAAAAGEEVDFH